MEMTDEILTLIKELEEKRKSFDNCFSTEEVLLVRVWNKAVDECINIVINKYA